MRWHGALSKTDLVMGENEINQRTVHCAGALKIGARLAAARELLTKRLSLGCKLHKKDIDDPTPDGNREEAEHLLDPTREAFSDRCEAW
jgi:hypothetical protein